MSKKAKKPTKAQPKSKPKASAGDLTFAKARCERLIREGGAARVSEGAVIAFDKAVGEFATKLAKLAVQLAEQNGRKTIKATDIDFAWEQHKA